MLFYPLYMHTISATPMMTPISTKCDPVSGSSSSALIIVMLGTFLPLTVSLVAVVLVQCVLILRMRKSNRATKQNTPTDIYSEVNISNNSSSSGIHDDTSMVYNEAYAVRSVAVGKEENHEYEIVK